MGFTHFSYPYGYDFAMLFGSCKELPTFPTHMGGNDLPEATVFPWECCIGILTDVKLLV
jgi:hypothetical protein